VTEESVHERRPRVVIIGAGFGGLSAAKALRHAAVQVTVVDARNHHLFQPLLYQVATAGLSPAQIAWPVRSILRDQANTDVMMDRVVGIDRANRRLQLERHGQPLDYDMLIVAAGARHAYFGHAEWEPYAPGLKTIEDATAIRRRLLLAFESAESSDDEAERRRLMTFVIVGGGPTGVELAGALAELAKRALARDFRHIDPRSARILLIEAGPRVLATFPPRLSEVARRSLEKLGVEVLLSHAVSQVDADGVIAGGTRIESRSVVWAAGVQASGAAAWLGVPADRAGRVQVQPDLTIPGDPHVFVIGDTGAVKQADGSPVPGIAPAAKQEGRYVARVIMARLAGRPAPGPFRYFNAGNLATIGRKAAVVDFGWLKMTGFPAWVLWSVVHIFFLIGLRSRIVVSVEWLWAYFSFQRGARLITGDGGAAPPAGR
jgi:NADH:ubiquinone reductase (H+-translocating)